MHRKAGGSWPAVRSLCRWQQRSPVLCRLSPAAPGLAGSQQLALLHQALCGFRVRHFFSTAAAACTRRAGPAGGVPGITQGQSYCCLLLPAAGTVHCPPFDAAPEFFTTQCLRANRLQLYGGRAESGADVANVLRVLLGSALEGAAAALPAMFADQVRETTECHWEHAVSVSQLWLDA
jgi:hypothetical protein